MVVNYCFHAFGANIAEFDPVFVKDLVEAVVLKRRGLNQIIFLLWLRLLWIFVLKGLHFNFC